MKYTGRSIECIHIGGLHIAYILYMRGLYIHTGRHIGYAQIGRHIGSIYV